MSSSADAAQAADAHPDDEALLSHVQSVWNRIRPNSAIYNILLSDVRLISAAPGTIVAHLHVQNVHVNSRKTLHGAVSAAIVDWAGGMAIATMGKSETGVSTDIHVSYLSAAKEGDVLEITGKVNKLGRSLGFTTVEIALLPARGGADEGQRKVVCTASHTKYIANAAPRGQDAAQAQTS
jgi:acyl-coenzyme A thioesterase 13